MRAITECQPRISAVYALVNIINNKRYVGSTKDLQARIRAHRGDLAKGSHSNKRLQADWNVLGPAFRVEVLERVALDRLQEREQFYIDALKAEYNELPRAVRPACVPLSKAERARRAEYARRPEVRMQVSERAREVWKRPGHRQVVSSAISAAKKGIPARRDHLKITRSQHRRERILEIISAWPHGERYLRMQDIAAQMDIGKTQVCRLIHQLRQQGLVDMVNRPVKLEVDNAAS